MSVSSFYFGCYQTSFFNFFYILKNYFYKKILVVHFTLSVFLFLLTPSQVILCLELNPKVETMSYTRPLTYHIYTKTALNPLTRLNKVHK